MHHPRRLKRGIQQVKKHRTAGGYFIKKPIMAIKQKYQKSILTKKRDKSALRESPHPGELNFLFKSSKTMI